MGLHVATSPSAFGGVDIALAFDDQNGLIAADRLDQARQAIGDEAHVVEVPNPSAVAVGPPLAEILRIVAA